MGDQDGKKTGKNGSSADNLAGCEVTVEKIDKLNSMFAPKIWLEVLPSQQGTVLAAILANIMSEGLTPSQKNILGDFINSLGALISYRAARDSANPGVSP